jgi:hypothetical protein
MRGRKNKTSRSLRGDDRWRGSHRGQEGGGGGRGPRSQLPAGTLNRSVNSAASKEPILWRRTRSLRDPRTHPPYVRMCACACARSPARCRFSLNGGSLLTAPRRSLRIRGKTKSISPAERSRPPSSLSLSLSLSYSRFAFFYSLALSRSFFLSAARRRPTGRARRDPFFRPVIYRDSAESIANLHESL